MSTSNTKPVKKDEQKKAEPKDSKATTATTTEVEQVYDAVPEIKHPGQRLQRLNFKPGFAGDLVFIDYMIKYWTTRKDYVIGLGDDSVKLDAKIKAMEEKLAALKAKKAPAAK